MYVSLEIHVAAVPVGMVLTWDNTAAVLEQAPNVTGPWTTVASAASPYTAVIGSEPRKFYRLRVLWPPN